MSANVQVEVIGEDVKVEETIYLNATHRLYRNRHGVKFVFLQTGSIYRWNFQMAFVAVSACSYAPCSSESELLPSS